MTNTDTKQLSPVAGLPPIPPKPEVPGWFSYSGRYTRAQFWWKYLTVTATFGIVGGILPFFFIDFPAIIRESIRTGVDPVFVFPAEFYMVLVPISIVCLIISFPLLVKRFHDINLSGWVPFVMVLITNVVSYMQLVGAANPSPVRDALLNLVSLACTVPMLIFLCRDSTRGTNAYGPSCKYPD